MDDGEGQANPGDDASDLARRQATLRALAQAQPQEAASTLAPRIANAAPRLPGAPTHHGAARRWIISALSVLAVVVVIAVVVANIIGATRPHAASAKPVLRIVPFSANLFCASQVVWSPDSKRIAVLGALNDCGGSQADSQTGAIFIYDAASGKLLQQAHPDQVIFKDNAVGRWIAENTTPSSAATALMYMSLTWAPNGQSMLLFFNLMADNPSSNGGSSTSGLLRLGLGSSALTHVWLDRYLGLQVGDYERWDLATGDVIQAPMPALATAYRWGAGGALIPASAPRDGAVGTADGGKLFTIWQSGFLTYPSFQDSANTKPTVSAQDIGWYGNLMPISPDGRYFYSYFPTGGNLTPPSTVFIQPGQGKIAPHDKALLTLAEQMTTVNAPTQASTLQVAYRPDGQLLAEVAMNNAGASGASANFTVSIYNTRTGALVKQLTPSFTGLQQGNAGQQLLAWSPDGLRLLLADNAYGAITIWGPGALPA
ncbi:MAG: hypothetical protein KGO05_16210 [Chloroflexota bacterium]|nr:hypothetical protein [Chloroflexota bacterium]